MRAKNETLIRRPGLTAFDQPIRQQITTVFILSCHIAQRNQRRQHAENQVGRTPCALNDFRLRETTFLLTDRFNHRHGLSRGWCRYFLAVGGDGFVGGGLEYLCGICHRLVVCCLARSIAFSDSEFRFSSNSRHRDGSSSRFVFGESVNGAQFSGLAAEAYGGGTVLTDRYAFITLLRLTTHGTIAAHPLIAFHRRFPDDEDVE